MIKPANRSSLHDNVLSQLIDGIRNGQWKSGECLPGEKVLAQQFQVSRNCIREVLKAMALANIVKAYPGRGTFITEDALQNIEEPQLASSTFGSSSLWELKEIRDLLEGHAAYLAAKRATPEQIRQLHDVLELESSPGTDITETHQNFHKMLMDITGNKLLFKIFTSIKTELNLLREKYRLLPKEILTTYSREHREIYEMVKEHRPEAARAAMLKHINAAWTDTFYEDLRGNKE